MHNCLAICVLACAQGAMWRRVAGKIGPILLVGFVFSTMPNQSAHAQGEVAELWKKLKARDAAVKTAHIKWKVVIHSPPRPTLDAEKAAARAAEAARLRGENEQKVSSAQTSVLETMTIARDGWTIRQTLDFQRENTAIRCDITTELASGKPNRSGRMPTTRLVDIDDGTNMINMAAGPAEDAPKRGRLTRDRKGSLMYSASEFGEPMLYANAPLLDAFPVSASTLKIADSQTVTIDKKYFDGFNRLARLTLSRNTLLPRKLEMINAQNGAVINRYEITGYKRFGGNAWFPASILKVKTSEVGVVSQEQRMSLDTASFTASDASHTMIAAVPVGAIIEDNRYGPKAPGRTYRVRSHVPSDAEYSRLVAVALTGDIQTAIRAQRRQRLLSAVAIGIPLVLVGFVGMLLVRLRRRQPRVRA